MESEAPRLDIQSRFGQDRHPWFTGQYCSLGTVSLSDPIIRLDYQRLRKQIGRRCKPTRASLSPHSTGQSLSSNRLLCGLVFAFPRSWRPGGWLGLGRHTSDKRVLSQRFDKGKLGIRNRLRLADIQRVLYGPVDTRHWAVLVFYQIEAQAKGSVMGRFVYARFMSYRHSRKQ